MVNLISNADSTFSYLFTTNSPARDCFETAVISDSVGNCMQSFKTLSPAESTSKDIAIIGSGLYNLTNSIKMLFIQNQLAAIGILAGILYYLSKLLSKKIFNLAKKSAYECGFEPFLLLKVGIEVGFVLVGFIFLIFDLELVFILGFLIAAGSIGSAGIILCNVYLQTVWTMIAFEIKTGVLSWPV